MWQYIWGTAEVPRTTIRLVEVEVEGLFWINRGTITDTGNNCYFHQVQQNAGEKGLSQVLWKEHLGNKKLRTQCYVWLLRKKAFVMREVCLERIFPEKWWNVPNNTTFCNVLEFATFGFVSTIYIASPLSTTVNRWQFVSAYKILKIIAQKQLHLNHVWEENDRTCTPQMLFLPLMHCCSDAEATSTI